MYIGPLHGNIFKKKCNVKNTRKHIISIWHPYNVYKPIWYFNHKEPNSLVEFYKSKGWFN